MKLIKTLQHNLRIFAVGAVAVLLAAVMLAGFSLANLNSGVSANAAGYTYIALGDSITTGYGLDDAENDGFVSILATDLNKTAYNAGVDGLTSTELLAALDATSENYAVYAAAISTAEVVTITIGGNDLLAVFYELIATLCNTAGGTSYTGENIKAILSNPMSNVLAALSILNTINGTDYSAAITASTEFTTAVQGTVSNINTIAATIKALNSDVVILVANQYNPYQWIGSSYANIVSLFTAGVTAYNTALSVGASGDYTIVDVASAFAASETTLTNADTSTYNFDIHPTAEGHAVIAATMESAYASVTGTEINPDPDTSDTSELEAEIADLQQQISDLEAQIADLEGQVSDLESDLSAKTAELEETAADLAAKTAELEEAQNSTDSSTIYIILIIILAVVAVIGICTSVGLLVTSKRKK